MAKLGKGVKICLLVVPGLFVAVALGAVFAVSYLRTPSGSEFLLSRTKKLLAEKAGARLEYAQGRVDPLAGAYFENLRLTQDQGGKHLDVSIRRVDLQYSISLFSRRIDVRKFEVEQPTIVYRSVSDTVAAPAPSAAEPARGNTDLARARKWITAPPAQITMHEMAVEHLSLELEQRDPVSSLQARIQGMSLHLALEWVRNRLALTGDLDLGKAGPLLFSQTASGSKLEAGARATGTSKWGVTIAPRSEGGWSYELTPLQTVLDVKEISVAQSGSTGELTAKLPSIHVDAASKFIAKTSELFVAEPGALQTADTQARVSVGAMTLDQAAQGKVPVRLVYANQELKLTSGLKNDFELATDYEGRGLFSSAYFTRPVSLNGSSNVRLTRDLKQLEVHNQFSLGGIRLKDAWVKASVLPTGKNGFEAAGKVLLTPDPRLAELIKPAAGLKSAGVIETELNFKTQASGQYVTLVDAAAGLSQAELQGQFDFLTTQKPGGKPAVRFAPIRMNAELSRDPVKNIAKVHLTADAPSILGASLKKACALGLASDIQWDGAQSLLGADATIQVQKQEAMHLKSQTTLKTDLVQTDATLDFKVGDYLEGLFSSQSLKGYGLWLLESQLQLKKSKDSFNESGSFTVSQQAAPGALAVSLPEPVKITHHLTMDPQRIEGEITGDMPLLESRKFGSVRATHFSAQASTPQSSSGNDVDVKMELKQGDIVLSEALAKKAPKIAGLEMSAQGQLRGGNELELQNFALNLGHSILTMSADASGKLKTRDFEARGITALRIPADFPRLGGVAVAGTVEVPWTLSVVQGKELDLDGTAFLEKLSAAAELGGVSGVSGSVPLSEKFKWDGKQIHFSHLITQNPFERVDFEHVRPLIEGASQVRVDELHWEEKTYGPLVAYFSMRQNMLQAQKLDMSLGQGRIYGEMFFDAYPANLQFGLLSRITNLDLGEVLPKKYLVKVPSGDKRISARTGIVMDFNKRAVDGRVDITQIGAAPLNLMIDVMDPQFQDEKMNKLRGMLDLGYPEYVKASLAQGYVDMTVGMHLLGGESAKVDIPGYDLSPLIADKTADVMKKTQEGPLK